MTVAFLTTWNERVCTFNHMTVFIIYGRATLSDLHNWNFQSLLTDCFTAGVLFSTLKNETSEIHQEKSFCQSYIFPAHEPVTLIMHLLVCYLFSFVTTEGDRVQSTLKHEPGQHAESASGVTTLCFWSKKERKSYFYLHVLSEVILLYKCIVSVC